MQIILETIHVYKYNKKLLHMLKRNTKFCTAKSLAVSQKNISVKN